MVPELTLLSCLLDKNYYNKYYQYVDIKSLKDTCKEVFYLYQALEELQEKTDSSPSLNDLQAYFFVRYPQAERPLYEGLFKTLQDEPLGESLPEVLLEEIKRRKVALKLSETAFQYSQGTVSYESLRSLHEQLHDPSTENGREAKRVTTRLSELLSTSYQDQGIRWRLNCLNKSLGSLRPGDFGFIFARPETGKTTFLASEIAHALTQVSRPIVWLNNEEQGEKVMLRIYQAYFGATLPQLYSNPAYYEERFLNETHDMLRFHDSAGITKQEIETIVEEEDPSLVVYDQLPKIKGFAADRDDLRLGAIFQWARELAKGSHAAIGVSQADGTAEGVRYLTMEHVANAKTAVQAEADWILGIGKVNDQSLEYVRYLNISKNKLFGDQDSDPSLRHGKFETIIEPLVARYEDVVEYQ